jgi:hypothetical protein
VKIDPGNQAAKDGIALLRIETPKLNEARIFLDDVQKFVAEQNPAPPSIAKIATAAAKLQIAVIQFDEATANESRQSSAASE